jgi:hypothetical protein
MHKQTVALDAATAMSYIGQTVLIEQIWEACPEPIWSLFLIVGVVLPMENGYPHGCFMVVCSTDETPFPQEIFFTNIRTIRAIRHRDRHSSGNVLGRMTRPSASRSGAALPAHRNGYVPVNGSTGAAHP